MFSAACFQTGNNEMPQAYYLPYKNEEGVIIGYVSSKELFSSALNSGLFILRQIYYSLIALELHRRCYSVRHIKWFHVLS